MHLTIIKFSMTSIAMYMCLVNFVGLLSVYVIFSVSCVGYFNPSLVSSECSLNSVCHVTIWYTPELKTNFVHNR